MFNPDTDFLFPSRVIPELSGLRGPEWDALIIRAGKADQTAQDHLAFVLMMVKLNGCQSCNADSFKAMRGCTACSIQSIERFSGKDEALVGRYEKAAARVQDYEDATRKAA